MGGYQNIVVGTDGSPTSLRAVDRAATLAHDTAATLVIVCAYRPNSREEIAEAQDVLGAEAYQIAGSAPAEDNLQRARDRAVRAGCSRIETVAVDGRPVDVIRQVAAERQADLVVVGNRGLNTVSGRLLGSVPADVARHSGVDVLIVHTS